MLPQGGFWSAFTAAPLYENEPPLLEGEQPWLVGLRKLLLNENSMIVELGINFDHIKNKTWTVLNPLRRPDQHIMDDADLAGPLLFGFCFGMFLLLV